MSYAVHLPLAVEVAAALRRIAHIPLTPAGLQALGSTDPYLLLQLMTRLPYCGYWLEC